MEIDMKHRHCKYCGAYIVPGEGFIIATEKPYCHYCNVECLLEERPNYFDQER